MKKLSRGIELADRFLVSCEQLGIISTLKIFSYIIPSLSKDRKIKTPGRKSYFYFHPVLDKGVLSHFYKIGYRILGDVEVILDIGANIGDETCRFRFFHPDATIVAVEPEDRNFALLQRNFDCDPLTHLIHGGLWHEKTVLSLSSSSTQEGYYLEDVKQSHKTDLNITNSTQVETFTIPELATMIGFKNISILKIDIEGAEKYIFCMGDTKWLENVDCIIMEMPDNDSPGSFQQICNAFAKFYMNYYICGENLVCIKTKSGLKLKTVIGFDR